MMGASIWSAIACRERSRLQNDKTVATGIPVGIQLHVSGRGIEVVRYANTSGWALMRP
jgi:hypothetical protein